MARSYVQTAAVTAADASDPNAVGPDPTRVFTLGKRGAGNYASGVAFIPVFNGGTTPTVSFDIWQKDGNSGRWLNLGSFATVGPDTRNVLNDLRGGDAIFAEITAIAGSPTDVAIAYQTI
jgi:hypothetical protein